MPRNCVFFGIESWCPVGFEPPVSRIWVSKWGLKETMLPPPENTDSGIVQEAERPCHALGDWRRTLQRGKCDFFDIHSVAVLLDEWALYWLVQFLALGVCWTLYQARHACILVCANPVWTEIVLHRSGGICAYQHLRILGPEFTGLGHFRSCTVDLPLSNYSTFFLVGCISMFVLYILCHSLWSMTLDHH